MTHPATISADPLAALAPPVRWLLERAAPDEAALALVSPSISLDQLYARWMQGEQVPSAIRLLAGVLPARESIWWAWVSARHATQMPGGIAPTAEAHAALGAVEQWIVRPDDDARRAAWDAGNAAGLDTPIGLVATAVFLSGTTIAPPSAPPTPPPPGVAMPLIAGVVQLCSASTTVVDQIGPTLVAFAAQGLEIVKRLGGWEAALQLAYDTHQRQAQDYARATGAPTGGK
jgi:hypothetical protein